MAKGKPPRRVATILKLLRKALNYPFGAYALRSHIQNCERELWEKTHDSR